MKILKGILFFIVLLIAVVLIVALFVKKEYTVARQISINKPVGEVFNYVKLLKNQDNYNKWVMQDPAMKKDFKGTDGTEGFVYVWNGNKEAGEGEQEIKKLETDKKVTCEIRFKRPMESTAITYFTTEAVSPTETQVKWSMEGRNNYPLNFMNLFMGSMLGKDIDTSLVKLKGILEK